MTADEWHTSDDLSRLLHHLRHETHHAPGFGERKSRLCAVACCRLAGTSSGVPISSGSSGMLAVVERHADGLIQDHDRPWLETRVAAKPGLPGSSGDRRIDWAVWWCFPAKAGIALENVVRVLCGRESPEPSLLTAVRASRLIRTMAGDPFLPPIQATGDLRTPLVRDLTDAAYEHRLPDASLDPVRLGILSDALEEQGCDDATLLGALRTGETLFRGCWPLDFLRETPP